MGTDFSNPENQTHKHMIPIIHTVFSRSPPGFFFSIWVLLEPSDFFNWMFQWVILDRRWVWFGGVVGKQNPDGEFGC